MAQDSELWVLRILMSDRMWVILQQATVRELYVDVPVSRPGRCPLGIGRGGSCKVLVVSLWSLS